MTTPTLQCVSSASRTMRMIPNSVELFEQVSFGVAEFDEQGIVRSANSVATALLQGVAGHRITAVLREMSEHVRKIEGYVEVIIQVAGSDLRLLVDRTSNDGYIACLERDPTRSQRFQIQILRTMLAAICEGGSLEKAGERVLMTLAWVMPETHLILYELHEQSREFVCLCQARVPPGQCAQLSPQSLEIDTPAARAVIQGVPVHYFSAEESSGCSTWALPVKSGDRILGALYACGPAETLGESQLRLLQGLADAAASLLLRSRQEMALQSERANRQALEAERERARRAIMERETLAMVGKLSSCVAHEINSPLAFIRTNLSVLGEYAQRLTTLASSRGLMADNPGESLAEIAAETHDIVQECLEGLGRITTIMSMLKGLSRLRPDGQTAFSPAKPIEDAAYMFERAKSQNGQTVLHIEPDLPKISGSPVALSQVVLNLLDNAVDAMGGKGSVSVRASRAGGGLRLEIADRGPGIPEEIRDRVFIPYFTTKPVGKGTGLGLYISQKLVEGMNGRIRFETGPSGTTFIVEYPEAME